MCLLSLPATHFAPHALAVRPGTHLASWTRREDVEMGLKPMHASHSTVLIGRRYLEHGFLDVAMRLFVRNAALVEKRDWSLLVERLMDRHRIVDAVRVCEIGGVPLPCAPLLPPCDGSLPPKDF